MIQCTLDISNYGTDLSSTYLINNFHLSFMRLSYDYLFFKIASGPNNLIFSGILDGDFTEGTTPQSLIPGASIAGYLQ